MASRGAQILTDAPRTSRRIERLRTGSAVSREAISFGGAIVSTRSPLGLDVSQNALSFTTGADMGSAMVWAEGSATWIEDDATEDGAFGVFHLGADWL
jgi:hypothetical protein